MERSAEDQAEVRAGLRRAVDRAELAISEIVLPRDEQVILRDHRFHYLDWGGDGPPIVLLHGGGLNAHTFDLICLALRDRFHCYALDLRGHGDSEWSPVMDYGLETHAGDVEAFVWKVGLKDFALLGMSLGGLTALTYAGTHNQEVAALVVLDIGPETQEAGGRRILDFMLMPSELDSIDDYIARAKAFNPLRDEVVLRSSLRSNLRQMPNGKWTWKYDVRHRKNAVDRIARATLLWQATDRITRPTLVVRGAKSDIFSPQNAADLVARLANGRLETVLGAGHTIQGDNPKDLVDVLRRFFAEVGFGPAS